MDGQAALSAVFPHQQIGHHHGHVGDIISPDIQQPHQVVQFTQCTEGRKLEKKLEKTPKGDGDADRRIVMKFDADLTGRVWEGRPAMISS